MVYGGWEPDYGDDTRVEESINGLHRKINNLESQLAAFEREIRYNDGKLDRNAPLIFEHKEETLKSKSNPNRKGKIMILKK